MSATSDPGKKRTALAEAVDAIARIFSGYALVAVIGIVMAGAWAIFGPTEDQLMSKYDLHVGHVQVAKKPDDCKFETAPLGQKNCHYEKRVVLLNHVGEIIGGDEVAANGKHVVTKPTGTVADHLFGSFRPAQQRIVRRLDALLSTTIDVAEANHVCGHFASRVIAAVLAPVVAQGSVA